MLSLSIRGAVGGWIVKAHHGPMLSESEEHVITEFWKVQALVKSLLEDHVEEAPDAD